MKPHDNSSHLRPSVLCSHVTFRQRPPTEVQKLCGWHSLTLRAGVHGRRISFLFPISILCPVEEATGFDSILALEYLFHVGQYPNVNGRKRDLVTREGKIGNWQDSEILDDPDSE